MLKCLAKTEKGFTLMELLIAVAIVAVLAGVGIPLYMGLQSRAKAAEATANLDGIGLSQEAYKLTNGVYIDCYASPQAVTAVTQNAVAWSAVTDPVTGETGFDLIGFDTNKPVRFSYAVEAAADGLSYDAGAFGDTDGDGNFVLYISSNAEGPRVVTAADTAAVTALQSATAFDDTAAAFILVTATTD
ncbi:TPA: prepilin-type N-terminal cleavage/methylation domain-containing protein [Candidatus Poribacteria bacterium]|nr:prepilin-type N-terminal cleavage/methylation domain-containing protein [Candidatus Poribacteria bacterium]